MPSDPPTPATAQPLSGREVIIAVCGGIAAYKAAEVVSKLAQSGAGVTVVMTDEAQKFITPLTFQALSGRPVRTGIFDRVEDGDVQHIALTERAQLMVVVPATTNIIAKVAVGLADDLVSLMISAAACPVVFVPAMNQRMWEHPIARHNVVNLSSLGYHFIGPESGWLACRNTGAGRFAEPPAIVDEITKMLTDPNAMPAPVGNDQTDGDTDGRQRVRRRIVGKKKLAR